MLDSQSADVCLLLEGTYPYVQGGVSAWVHQILREMPDTTFALFFIGSKKELNPKQFYELPKNVVNLTETYIFEKITLEEQTAGKIPRKLEKEFFASLDRLYFGKSIQARSDAFWEILNHLDEGQDNFTFGNLTDGKNAWELLKKVYRTYADEESFIDFFWSTKFMHLPLWMLLKNRHRVPKAKVYHAISTGYAGLIGAIAAHYNQKPYFITEHGIYTKERIAEISQADWIREREDDFFNLHQGLGVFKVMWIELFNFFGHISYLSAEKIIALFQGNNRLQIDYGAPADRLDFIPNGIDPSRLQEAFAQRKERRAKANSPVIIGFVGRIVPIKDVKTLIRAAYTVVRKHPGTEFWLAGPTEEEPDYYRECQEMITLFQLEESVKFVGRQNIIEFFPTIDVMVLTSISEGLPLVIIEGFCVGVPVVSTDVGACRELIFGATNEDRAIGKAGLLTKISSPDDTASALGALVASPELIDKMGDAGRERVGKFYVQSEIINRYLDLYRNTSWSRFGAPADQALTEPKDS